MALDQERGQPDNDSTEDALSALKRLAALDRADADVSNEEEPSQAADLVERIPDWLASEVRGTSIDAGWHRARSFD